MPTYNRAALLAEALESVRVQEFTDFELIVVDDGSTDDTAAVLARFGEGQSPEKFRVLHQTNGGPGAARNLALSEARGEYCTFLDSDDLFFPWSLAIVAQAISHARPSVMICSFHSFDCSQEFAEVSREPLQTTTWPDLYAFAVKHHLGPCGVLVARTELLREVGGFLTERIVGEDLDLMLRLGCAPVMVNLRSPPLYGYRLHADNFTLNYERWYQGACQLLRRYRQGIFPGGAARRREIRWLTAQTVGAYGCIGLYFGARRKYRNLYFKSLAMQLRAGNFLFVFTTPFFLALNLLRLWPKKLGDERAARLAVIDFLKFAAEQPAA